MSPEQVKGGVEVSDRAEVYSLGVCLYGLLAGGLGPYMPDKRDPSSRYATYWGQDPLYISPTLELPLAGQFRNAALVAPGVMLSELPGQYVTVVGYKPEWDKTLKLWTVDLDLPTAGHYFPFVRLALARFQPRALLDSALRPQFDFRLSSVILADFVQTAPDRALTLTRDGGGAGVHRVHVSGATYTARRRADNGAIHATSAMWARLERRAPEIADEALAWSPLPGAAETLLAVGALDGNTQHWEGAVAVPTEAAGETLRLVVREIEEYQNDRARRTVYVDTVAL